MAAAAAAVAVTVAADAVDGGAGAPADVVQTVYSMMIAPSPAPPHSHASRSTARRSTSLDTPTGTPFEEPPGDGGAPPPPAAPSAAPAAAPPSQAAAMRVAALLSTAAAAAAVVAAGADVTAAVPTHLAPVAAVPTASWRPRTRKPSRTRARRRSKRVMVEGTSYMCSRSRWRPPAAGARGGSPEVTSGSRHSRGVPSASHAAWAFAARPPDLGRIMSAFAMHACGASRPALGPSAVGVGSSSSPAASCTAR